MCYRWGLLLLVVWYAGAGCAWARRPFADDPLLRDGRGVWGDPRTAPPVLESPPEPQPPPPPFPENLPTLEWERR
ncbi:MAG: hypothetical protein NZU63_01190 [Gemmataceae bacterium]|nr:hypothetical protein [Gemmataceae bacterium]MDW8244543.1 hypothetical protein [Thermogemmata sp.]